MKLDNSNSAHKLMSDDCQYLGYKSNCGLDIDIYLTDNIKGLKIEIDGNTFIYSEMEGTIEKQ